MKSTSMHKQILLVLLAGIFINLNTHAQPTGTGQWISYTDTAFAYTVSYPAAWEFKPLHNGSRFVVTSKLENNKDAFKENIGCIVRRMEQAPKEFSLRLAEEAVKKELAARLKDLKIIATTYTTWNKAEALNIEYTFTQEQDFKQYKIHIWQRMAVIKGNLFNITYTADEAGYKKYLPVMTKLLSTLKVKPQ